MKRIIAILICAISIMSTICLVGCDKSVCVHDYKYTIVSQPTCENKGEMEGICSLCGNKIYQEIVELGHDYVNHTCIRCGKINNAEYLPQGSTVGLTLNDIYNKAKNYNIEATSEQEFLNDLSNITINNLYIKSNKLYFDFTDGKNYCFWWNIDKVELPISSTVVEKLLTVKVEKDSLGYKLNVIYNDGTKSGIGYFEHVSEGINTISRLAVNTSNQLIVIFKDNIIAKLGSLLSVPADIDDSVLIYEQYSNTDYKVVGIINKEVEEIVIPKTHRGKPVRGIASNAFKDCANVKKVVIDKNITVIGNNSFYGCNKLTSVTYKGSESDKMGIYIMEGNEKLTNATWTFEE